MLCAVIQMNSQKNVDANLIMAEALISKAAQQGTKLVVLPEMFASLGVKQQHQLAITRFSSEGVLAQLASWSKQYNVYLIAGSIPMATPQNAQKVYSASLFFSPSGKQLATYKKMHLFDVSVEDEKGNYKESDTFLSGASPEFVEFEGLKLGLSICYDLRFPELFQYYMKQGCQLMSVPSAFTYTTGKAHWEILIRARAIETQTFILAANQVGVHEDGRRTWGHSMIVAPDGIILAQVEGDEPGLAIAELDFLYQQKCRQAMPLLSHKHLK